MGRRIRYFLAGIFSFVVIYGCVWLLGFLLEKGFDSGFKGSDIIMVANTVSPNHGFIASTYVNSGGGGAGWCEKMVNLRKSEEPFDSKKRLVFSSDCQSDVEVIWKGDDTAMIKYSTDGMRADLFQRSLSDDKAVRVFYQTK